MLMDFQLQHAFKSLSYVNVNAFNEDEQNDGTNNTVKMPELIWNICLG